MKEMTAEVADLQRRIERQVANLEAEDATPALRRRIAARIAELTGAGGRPPWPRKRPIPPSTPADLATALDRLPLIERLQNCRSQSRHVFDSLRLQVAFSARRGRRRCGSRAVRR
jgi:hypothetical protein